MTFLDVVKDEAAKLPAPIAMTSQGAAWFLWECTGFPSFWQGRDGETVEDEIRRRVREELATLKTEGTP